VSRYYIWVACAIVKAAVDIVVFVVIARNA